MVSTRTNQIPEDTMRPQRHYIVGFTRSGFFGREEYDGGHTIAEARKEAAHFRENLPASVEVSIYYVVRQGLALKYVETFSLAPNLSLIP